MIAAKYKRLTSLFIILSATYIALTVLLPPDKAALAKYHLTASQAIALGLTISLPYLVIWFIALVGYLRLRSYTDSIAHTKDGDAFLRMSQGIFLFAAWLPISAIMGSLTAWYGRDNQSSMALMTAVNNYVNIIILFAAFWIIYQSSKQLLAIVKRPISVMPLPLMLIFLTFSALYVFMVLHDPARQFSTKEVSVATYYLPDWLTITTIVIPRLIMWFLGIQAVCNLFVYRSRVKGPIYKQALNNLARGIAWVVVTIIVLRCYQSLSSQLSHLSLALILLVIYALLILISVGYVLIAKGAKKLQRIEEI